MGFCWFVNARGYPNFVRSNREESTFAQNFCTLAGAAVGNVSYKEAKPLLNMSIHQAETVKKAFQDFGLLYVIDRSDQISLTPLGDFIYRTCCRPNTGSLDRRVILLALGRALARYQFANPSEKREVAQLSNVLPYLACYYLMQKLDGYIIESELLGAVYGLQNMTDLRVLEQQIRDRRRSGMPFPELPVLPSEPGTKDNLRIYFVARLGLAKEIVRNSTTEEYGKAEPLYELTELGTQIVRSILDEAWPDWKHHSSIPPSARVYTTVEAYFNEGIGQACPNSVKEANARLAREMDARDQLDTLLDPEDLDDLKEQPQREYQEGRRKYRWHALAERNVTLIREAKRLFKAHHGQLFCEACGFNFSRIYGDRGDGYIEAHHKVPISQLTSVVHNSAGDLAMVCSNCHRMLHRRPWITVEELTLLLKASNTP